MFSQLRPLGQPKIGLRRVENGGRRITEKLWSLTPAGLEAAAHALERPVKEMGGTARAAAASGAKHALKVTDVLAAFVQQPVEPTGVPVARTRTVPRQGALRGRPPGLGPLSAWSTEVTLPVAGTFTSPAKGSLRADALFALPGAEIPLLFVEVDNGTETRGQVAAKLDRYARFFARAEKSRSDGRERPLWRSVWTAPDEGREQPHPPVAIVFTKAMGPEAMDACMRGIAELSAPVWQGEWHPGRSRDGEQPDGFRTFGGRVPVVACRLDRLAADGPHGPIWWRYGRKRGGQTLTAALDNNGYYSRDAYQAREAARRREAEDQAAARKAAAAQAREASRWPCPGCGKPVYPGAWAPDTPGSPCHECHHAADVRAREAHDAAQLAAEQEELARQQRQDGWLGWLRS
ncbi:replication-relaxation family protein [Streptomyces sp. NPDC090085]|uniref:replication-relaxation family protein n=1 Tax=Streptomyces sp. NPDC090085 TaxID=3365943 RepID=UPI0037FF30E6